MRSYFRYTVLCSVLVFASVSTAAAQKTANPLTGTYQLDPARSDNVRARVESATAGAPAGQRDQLRNTLMQRLQSPEKLAIERKGNAVTIASTLGPQLTVKADGRPHSEKGTNTSVQGKFEGNKLTISADTDSKRDYSLTIEPLERGKGLRLTRTITAGRLDSPVVITSVYDKTSETAQLDLYKKDDVALRRPDRNIRSYVPSGTELTAVLDSDLNTKEAKDGDQFTMTVQSPGAYKGAVVEGYVSDVGRPGPFTGRANMSFKFERIKLTNGQTHDFAADIKSVKGLGGDEVRVGEGQVENKDSQTEETAKRTGGGAALGAIIGAIAGGGKGAAIGAAVGAGAGAGSVYVTGRDDLELDKGTEFVLIAVNTDRQGSSQN